MNMAYMRSEATNEYTLFLNVQKSLLEKNIDIQLEESGAISLRELGQEDVKYITKPLPQDILSVVSKYPVVAIFMDDEANVLADHVLDLSRDKSQNNKKARP